MKLRIYFLLAVLLSGIVAPVVHGQKTILIRATDPAVPTSVLTQSATTISGRLKDYSTGRFTIAVIPEQQEIAVTLIGKWDEARVKDLMVHPGKLGFYPVYTFREMKSRLGNEFRFYTWLTPADTLHEGKGLGCIPEDKIGPVNEYIRSLDPGKSCLFAWGASFDHSDICLYALKSDASGQAWISGKNVENMIPQSGSAPGKEYIQIHFKQPAIPLWYELTRQNLNHAIALVIDNRVFFDPLVREPIAGGNCQITGNFTPDQVKFIAALGNNGELPVTFTLVP